MHRALCVTLVVGSFTALVACTTQAVCSSGTTEACRCSDGAMGSRACNVGGTFDACVCASGRDGGASDASIDSARVDAAVTDGGAPDAPVPDAGSSYDMVVLADHPVGFWRLSHATGPEPDLSGHGNDGIYHGGTPALATLPNGDPVVVFDGASEYLSIPSRASYSIPTTGSLTWEAWIRPDVLMFPHSTDGYVDWMGKCESYSPTCEWEARMYDAVNPQGRCDRLSAYAFNPTANLGSGADWQPTCGLFSAGDWLYVVGEYTTLSQPADCPVDARYPGSLNIWVNGVPWSQSSHSPTGCMSQYSVVPVANESPVNVGSMALDSWFAGAIGKVAIYDVLLSQAQIDRHYVAMTGAMPSGSCGNTCTSM